MDLEVMRANAAQASALLKSLANPSRLMVLCALVNREHTVGELEEITGLSQSAISQHMARLRDEKIVATRREAQWIYYSLDDEAVKAILGTMHELYCPEDEF
ncbi:MAG: metalloregulator ArsR/SmtB family transcription factor [Pseudomonadota bacterium]|nr:metalloregulator ArsR/SmtB family transcription factor [Pseudomonadota bacterium]